jgi:hypothetical protein
MTTAAQIHPLKRHHIQKAENRFYLGMAVAAILTAVAGFVPSIVYGTARRGPISVLLIVHGILCFSWLLVFLTQVRLAATRRLAVHRRIGPAAGVLAAGIAVIGYYAVITLARRGFDLSGDLHIPPIDPAFQLVFALGDLLTFVVLLSAAFLYKHRVDVHKRLMLLATLGGMMPAALVHVIGHVPALSRVQAPIILIPLAAFYFAGAVFDRIWIGRIHPISLWLPVALLIWANLRALVIGPSVAWHHLLGWLAGGHH